MSSILPPSVIKSVQTGLLNKYFIISAEAVLFYDYFVMLPAEIEHIWMSKWGVGNVLYMLTRYLAFLESSLMVNYKRTPWPLVLRPHTDSISHSDAFNTGFGFSVNSQTICERVYRAGCWVNLAGIIVACNILYLRTAAIWGWSRRAMCCVAITNMIIVPTAIYGIQSYLNSMNYLPSPVPGIFPCNVEFSKSELYLDFIEVLVIESGVLFLTVYKRNTAWPENQTPLLRTLYWDAVLFFGCLCTVSIANLVLFTTPGLNEYYQLLVQFQSAMHSITTSRIILHLRITGSEPASNDGSVLLSKEYMRKNAFRSPSYSADTEDVDSQWDSMELNYRGEPNSLVIREERKSFLVVDPYMI
ncbi:hypothetical protein SCHPADRAFT_66615 [Schizopora paradoxa]|uniref:DUF6533 domain-containing protein n=1 Tax=Schizopora paradoxa TaxID=27342 RepID=A0A0H2S6H8_9AGAM|nr:hypothetical protein SCHPADRAFT_66615 [Schizopora paradoxa]